MQQDKNILACGINFPEMLLDLALGEAVQKVDSNVAEDGLTVVKAIEEVILKEDAFEKFWVRLK